MSMEIRLSEEVNVSMRTLQGLKIKKLGSYCLVSTKSYYSYRRVHQSEVVSGNQKYPSVFCTKEDKKIIIIKNM